MARPTKYNKEYNEKATKLARLGATDKEIADFFNVTEQTLNNWKIKEPQFFESIKKGKIESDINVANSLYKRAIGYTTTEKKTEELPDGNTKLTFVEKEVIPDVAAINIWLKNRRGRIKDDEGQRWADKQEIDHSSKDGTMTPIKGITFKE